MANYGGSVGIVGNVGQTLQEVPQTLHVDWEVQRLAAHLENLESELKVLVRRLDPLRYDTSLNDMKAPDEAPPIAPHASTLRNFAFRIRDLTESVAEVTRSLQI